MGLWKSTTTRVRLLAVAAAGSAALIVTGAMAAQAETPPVPVPEGIPGGFSTVLTHAGVGPAGGTVGPATSGMVKATVQVPPGAFQTAVNVEFTQPNTLDAGQFGGLAAYRVIGGVGVFVGLPGGKLTNAFDSPLSLRLSDPAITPASVVVAWNGMRWVRVPAVVSGGMAKVSVTHDPAYLVLSPLSSARSSR